MTALLCIWSVFKREIGQIKKNPLFFLAMIVIPVLICFFVSEIFSSGTLYNLPVAVLDEDNSELSRKIVRKVDATPSCSVKYRMTNLLEGENLIKEGKSYALLVIPRDFERDIIRKKQPKVALYYNNQTLLIGGIISKDITSAVRSDGAKANLIGISEHIKSNPYLNYSYFLVMGSFIHVFQVMIAFLAIYSFGVEFKNSKTKELMEVSGHSILSALFGKLLPYFLLSFAMILSVYLIYYLRYSPPLNGSIGAILLSTALFIFAYQITGVMFVAITSNLRLSLSCGAFYTAMGFTFAGLTYPIIAMPAAAKFYSHLLPMSHYLKILVDQIFRGIPAKYDLSSFFALLALTLLGIAFLPLLKKNYYDESKWGRL